MTNDDEILRARVSVLELVVGLLLEELSNSNDSLSQVHEIMDMFNAHQKKYGMEDLQALARKK